jgi:hypothetical protein
VTPRTSSIPRRPSIHCRLGRIAGAAAAAAAAGVGLLAAAAPAAHAQLASTAQASGVSYTYTTLDNQADPTFNQLLGINTHNTISGYFGSGAAGHPNQGYTIAPPYGQANYTSENFPGSVQTQVVGLNNKGDTVGFWANSAGSNFGFVEWNGSFTSYRDPLTSNTTPSMNQLLGINDSGIAVGFYVRGGVAYPDELNQATGVFTTIKHVGIGKNSFATGINDAGDIVGYTMGTTSTYGWLLKGGHVTTFQFPGSLPTLAFGINKNDTVVGSFTDSAGDTHGFVLKDPTGPVSHWIQIDDPNALNTPGDGTTVNGINNAGDLVGFYTDVNGNVNGMLATP